MTNEPFCTMIEPLRIHSVEPVRVCAVVTDLFPFTHVLSTHQGRAAERILFAAASGSGRTVPNNTHVGTTGASCIKRHAVASAWLSGADTPAARGGVADCPVGRHAAARARQEARWRFGAAARKGG